MDNPVTPELIEVLSYYDLGQLVDYEKNERGFVNTAYAICTLADGQRHRYFLRKYKPGIHEEEIVFEHSLIERLVEAGSPVARIQHTRSGRTFLFRPEGGEQGGGAFYTIFEFLPGEDRFTWINPILSEAQLVSSAAVLAQLHIDGRDFTPLGKRDEPRILELLPVIAETWSGCPARSKGTVFDEHIRACLEPVRDNIAATMTALQESAARSLPRMVIHCDYHPGNLKFSGDRVTGVFDFDWSKVDFRLFDLGLATWYFCTSWGPADDGSLRMKDATAFLKAYQETLAANAAAMRLTADEADYLPIMINAGNLYVLHWTILDYFAKDVDPEEYLAFLDHSLRFTAWYEEPANRQALLDMAVTALN